MSAIDKIDPNFKVETKIEKDDIRFYNVFISVDVPVVGKMAHFSGRRVL